jgi:hypothetical protein
MERDPRTPSAPEATTPPLDQKRAHFFDRWKKTKRRRPATKQPAPEVAAPQNTPESVAPQLERKSFGKNILRLLRGSQQSPEAQQPQTPEAQAGQPQAPELTPQYDRATRMRRLARVIIANVIGQANQEPVIAQKNGEPKPLNMQPLAKAAQNLQSAANNLSGTISQVQASPDRAASFAGGGNFNPVQPERSAPLVEQAAGDRIDRRLRRLEAAAEENRAASVAAVGLGVLAVLLVGTEYFGRKRADRKIVRETSEQFTSQQKEINQQRREFDRFREEKVAIMNRNERRDYYERLSSFTAQQTERTTTADRELQEVVIARTPEAVATTPLSGEIFERRQYRPRQQERAAATREVAQESAVEQKPLVRVEKVEHTEHQPGQQTGSAGTGFFGGGGGGIAQNTGPSDLNPPRAMLDPNSPEVRKLEALRRAEQIRLQRNAWFYGAALIATLVGAVIAAIFIG